MLKIIKVECFLEIHSSYEFHIYFLSLYIHIVITQNLFSLYSYSLLSSFYKIQF